MAAKKKYPCTVDNCISLRGPYQYRVQIRRRGFKIDTMTFETIDEARLYRDKILSDINTGGYKSTNKAKHTSLRDLLIWYTSEIVPSLCVSNEYVKQLQSRILHINNYDVADIMLLDLQSKHLQYYRDARLKEGRKRKTIKEDLAEICRAINWGIDEYDINLPYGNPVDVKRLLKRLKNDAFVREPIRTEGLETILLKACSEYGDGHTLHDIVNLGLRTGMRRGQLVKLLWENIFLDDHIAKVINKNRKRDNIQLIDVVLSDAAVEVLKNIGEKKTGKVFCYTSPATVTKALERIRNKAEYKAIPDFELITPHILRHTAAFRLKQSGVSKDVAKLVTGHSSDSIFENYGKLQASDVAGKIPNV